MSQQVFVIRNQDGLYLSKQQEWVDGSDNQLLFRCSHLDEALNTVFEVSAREITLRATALACPLDARNHPRVDVAGQLDFSSPRLEQGLEEPVQEPPSVGADMAPQSADSPGADGDETLAG